MITASFSGLNSGAPPASVLRSWSTSIDATSLCINSHNCSIKHLNLMRTPYPCPQYITLPTLLLLMLQRTKGETEALAPLTTCLWHLKLTIRKMSPQMFSPASLLSSNKLCCSAKPRNEKKKKIKLNQRRHQSGSGRTVQKHKGSPHENRHPPESPTKRNKEANDLESPLQQQRSFLVYLNP